MGRVRVSSTFELHVALIIVGSKERVERQPFMLRWIPFPRGNQRNEGNFNLGILSHEWRSSVVREG